MAVAVTLLAPILIPIALVLHTLGERRKRATARDFRCTRCGAFLGAASVRLADEEWAAHVERLHKENPGVRLRLCRWLHAVCVTCGQQYAYQERENTFTALAEHDELHLQHEST